MSFKAHTYIYTHTYIYMCIYIYGFFDLFFSMCAAKVNTRGFFCFSMFRERNMKHTQFIFLELHLFPYQYINIQLIRFGS